MDSDNEIGYRVRDVRTEVCQIRIVDYEPLCCDIIMMFMYEDPLSKLKASGVCVCVCLSLSLYVCLTHSLSLSLSLCVYVCVYG